MKSLIGASLAAVGLVATSFSSQAADMPVKAYRSPVMSYYNWTGLYVGLNAGYGFGTSAWTLPAVVNVKPKGPLFGGTAGYNWQTGAIVVGVEGDFDWANLKGTASCAIVLTCETKQAYLATFRGRVGYAFDRLLPYITAGGAYGSIKATVGPGPVFSATKADLGWTAGAGLEYAMMGNWSVKVEYLYVRLGSFDLPAPLTDAVTLKENIVRVGLNYKFAGPVYSRF